MLPLSCAAGTIAAILWLSLLRAPTAPKLLESICTSTGGITVVRILGIGLLLASISCWIRQSGMAVGLSLALATIMAVGAPLPFLMARANFRGVLQLALVVALGCWTVAGLTR